jgi:PAS domain S-box-containing protein
MIGALLAGCYLAAASAVFFAPEGDPGAAWWPAAGFAVALLAFSPRRAWPALALGVVAVTALANVTGGRDVAVSVPFGVANAAEAVVAAAVLRHGLPGTPRLETPDDFLRLVRAAVAGGAVIAHGAATTVAVVQSGSFLHALWPVFAAHSAATLVLVPIAMALRSGHREGRTWELALQVGVFAVVTLVVFAPHHSLSLGFVPVPLLIWAALRFDVYTVAWELAAFSGLTTFFTARGNGPFGDDYARGDIGAITASTLTQGYLLCATLLALPLAIAVQQRSALLERVRADEQLFRRNFTDSLVGMAFLRGEDGRLALADINETGVAILGHDRESLLGRHLDELVTHESLADVTHALLAGEQDNWQGSVTLTALTGRPRARVTMALSLLSATPVPIVSAQLQDVTAEYDARRRLESAEKLTSATLDTAACAILVTDPDGRIVRVNAATRDISGFEEADLLGRLVWETPISPAEAAEVEALFLWPNRSGVPAVRERDARTKDGRPLRIVWNTNIVHDERGNPAHAVMTGIDVTAERASVGLVTHLMQAAISTALIGIDTSGRVTVFNSGAQHLLGYPPAEIVGQPFCSLLDPVQLLERTGTQDPRAAFPALIRGLEVEEESRAGDWTWVDKFGVPHVVAMTLSVAEDAFAFQVGFLCVGTDVTEQRRGQEMLVAALEKERTAVERLRALDEAKNEFVSTVSHELRTPVTSIVGYAEMLTDGSIGDPSPEQLPLIRTIARNGQRLIAVCNDLLLLSGLDDGAVTWEKEPLDLAAEVRQVEETVRPLLVGRNLKVEVSAPLEPVPVIGDRTQLERALMNLLSNAVKFTDDGGSIDCRLETEGAAAVLTVRDTGIGIPVDEQAGLFQKFYRTSTAQKLAIQGTGLGLSIVSAIVSAHGGRITVRSAEGEGATFTVRLPLAR